MSSKNSDFEGIFEEIERSVNKIEEGSLSVSESMKIHKETVDKIEKARKMLKEMESKITEISDPE